MSKSNVKYRMGMALGLLIIISIAVFFFYYLYPQETAIEQLLSNPQIYNGRTVKVCGLVVENTGSFWGERYDLYQDYPTTMQQTHIALAPKNAQMNMTQYVSFTCDGVKFQRVGAISNPFVVVEGVFHDQGQVLDAPRFYIEVSAIRYSGGI